MIEKAQLKTQGLEFARSLQRVFKIALLYSINHTAVSTSLEQSYAALTSLLEVTKPFPFTFGFANQAVAGVTGSCMFCSIEMSVCSLSR